MPPMSLIREEPHLPVTGELSWEGPQKPPSKFDSSIGDARSQPVRSALQLFPAVQRREPALWVVWAWRFLNIHVTPEKARPLSSFFSANKLNRWEKGRVPRGLLRPCF